MVWLKLQHEPVYTVLWEIIRAGVYVLYVMQNLHCGAILLV